MTDFSTILVLYVLVGLSLLLSFGVLISLSRYASRWDLNRYRDACERDLKEMEKTWDEDLRKLRNFEQRLYKKGWHEEREAAQAGPKTPEEERRQIVADWKARHQRGGAA